MTIGPEQAATLLKLNHNNRLLNMTTVIRYASDMSTGRWRNVGDPIRFNGTDLLDGQHRLSAIVMSGVTLEMYVIDGLTQDDMAVIDTGKPRTLGDTLRWAGATNVSATAGITRKLCGLAKGYNLGGDTTPYARLSKSEQLEFYQNNTELVEWAGRSGLRIHRQLGGGKVSWGTALGYLVTNGAARLNVDEFVSILCEGIELTDSSPIWALRNWAIRMTVQRKRVREDQIVIITVRAYNHWRNGTKIKQMKMISNEQIQPVVVD